MTVADVDVCDVVMGMDGREWQKAVCMCMCGSACRIHGTSASVFCFSHPAGDPAPASHGQANVGLAACSDMPPHNMSRPLDESKCA